jgi:hypothetical protein
VHDTNDLEARGIPSVFLATVEFTHGAEVQAKALGFNAKGLYTPHPVQDRTDSEMIEMADAIFEDVVRALVE